MSELVTFGETMLRYTTPTGKRFENADFFSINVGGAESNVAAVASRLGVDAVWLSKLHDSPLGHRIERTLHSQGVETEIVWSNEGRQGVYYFETGGAPRGSNIFYDRSNAAVTTATTNELATWRIETADVFYTSGITPALSETLAATTASLLKTAQAAGTTVAFDVNYRSKLWGPESALETLSELIPFVDVLVVAKRDAETVLGRSGEPETVGRALLKENDHEVVVITCGDRGSLAVTDEAVIKQPTFEAETHDPIGTGDAFVGGFLTQRLEGGSLAAAMEYGAATAALKRTLSGDIAPVSKKDVEKVIDGTDDISR